MSVLGFLITMIIVGVVLSIYILISESKEK